MTITEADLNHTVIGVPDAFVADHLRLFVELAEKIDAYASELAGADALLGHAMRAPLVANLRATADDLRADVIRIRNAEPF